MPYHDHKGEVHSYYDWPPRELNLQNLKDVVTELGLSNKLFVLAQAVLETGNFRSRVCTDYNNLFGLYDSKNGEYFRFARWEDIVPLCCHAQERATSPFNTVGDGYKHPKPSTVREKESLDDVEEETEAENMTNLSADSIKTFMPLVALPLKRIRITSPYGVRRDPLNRQCQRMHSGLDLKARFEEVYSMLPGTVTAAAYSPTGGYYITVNHGALVCSYLHLSKILVRQRQHVSAGQVIAISGNSGKRTTGPHLHIACRWGDEKGKFFNPLLLLGYIVSKMEE